MFCFFFVSLRCKHRWTPLFWRPKTVSLLGKSSNSALVDVDFRCMRDLEVLKSECVARASSRVSKLYELEATVAERFTSLQASFSESPSRVHCRVVVTC